MSSPLEEASRRDSHRISKSSSLGQLRSKLAAIALARPVNCASVSEIPAAGLGCISHECCYLTHKPRLLILLKAR
jgi:hypothetical protein